jgi:hypothetical protein
LKTAAELKAILGKDFPSQVAKIIDHIDPHCRTWIERCPFCGHLEHQRSRRNGCFAER